MKFSIVTPSYNQLDWLRLCVASVRDQVEEIAEKLKNRDSEKDSASVPPDSRLGKRDLANGNLSARNLEQQDVSISASQAVSLSVEHIIQDAGSPGIEEFAREVGADFYREGKLIFSFSASQDLSISRYRLAIYCERDGGMYDAVNRGFCKATGSICAYLNCDEQYLPHALSMVDHIFSCSQRTDIVSAACLVVSSHGELIAMRPGLRPWTGHILLDHLPIFSASLFYRRSVVENKWAHFDPRLRDVADATWVVDRLREGCCFKAVAFPTTAFTDTGSNMNLKSNARREAAYLRKLAPRWMSACRRLIILLHRLKKAFLGCYWPRCINYSIYTLASRNVRVQFRNQITKQILKNYVNVVDNEISDHK